MRALHIYYKGYGCWSSMGIPSLRRLFSSISHSVTIGISTFHSFIQNRESYTFSSTCHTWNFSVYNIITQFNDFLFCHAFHLKSNNSCMYVNFTCSYKRHLLKTLIKYINFTMGPEEFQTQIQKRTKRPTKGSQTQCEPCEKSKMF
jgi:hypothetical protein